MFACIHVPELSVAGQSVLRKCASAFSPIVELTDAETVTVALEGVERLFGGPEAIARRMWRQAVAAGLQARVAAAANADAARVAARGYPGVTVVPPGREAEILAPLPVEVLPLPEEIAATLERWGVRTLGELAALPEEGLAERLGAEGVRLHQVARGALARSLIPAVELPELEEALELEHPVACRESLAFLLGRLLGQLCERLRMRGLAAIELRLRLELEDGGEHVRVHRLPVPMRAPRAFLKLLELDLEAHPPQAAVQAVRVAVEPAAPRSVQQGLFVPAKPDAEKLELTLARLAGLVGEDGVGAPEVLDTHRPDAFRLKRFTPAEACLVPPRRSEAALVLRRFRPPWPAEVRLKDGRPAVVLAPGAHGRVVEVAGPWRISGEWWRAEAYCREEFDVALSDGGLYRISRDCLGGGWFVVGSYD